MTSSKICTLVPPSPERDQSVSLQADDWPEDSLALGVVKSKRWRPGHTIKIKLIRGSKAIREKVERYAREWTRHANIHMEFVDDIRRAEIRVSFVKGGSWSMVGTDCLTRTTGATMNFGWFDDKTPDYEVARTVYHEFGHALGCVHEHQNPRGGILWDEARVYDHYAADMGWDRDKVNRNVLWPVKTDTTQFTQFDNASIMLYHFPRELTRNGHFVDPNYILSETDKAFISRMYPMAAMAAQAQTPPESISKSPSSTSLSGGGAREPEPMPRPKSKSKPTRPRRQPLRQSARIAGLRARQTESPSDKKRRHKSTPRRPAKAVA